MLRVILAVLALLGPLVQAQAAAPEKGAHVKAELVSEARDIVPCNSFRVSVRLTMDKGWHTYSDPPGDSGMPTKIVWDLPPGFSAGAIEWPKPKKFREGDIVSLGYDGQADLKVSISAPARVKGKAVTLKARVQWLECKDACLTGEASVRLTLPVRAAVSVKGT